ncbi:hypothetical protein ACERCG_06010 [Mannheimia sp. E30BD]|uniref:hypothetical protein n=1 Tax=Mannheimia sp. E30BD TaxID=3278708 RepID=UPI00359EE617
MGYERLQEINDPSQSLDRARENWQKMGQSEKWIQQRMMGQETRNKLTDYWKSSGVEQPQDFAFLTNVIHQEWSGLSVQKHKSLKGLQNQNLRDHMTEAELLFTALAELSSRQIAESMQAVGVDENAQAGKQGGNIAKNARQELENKTGKSVITGENFFATIYKRRRKLNTDRFSFINKGWIYTNLSLNICKNLQKIDRLSPLNRLCCHRILIAKLPPRLINYNCDRIG